MNVGTDEGIAEGRGRKREELDRGREKKGRRADCRREVMWPRHYAWLTYIVRRGVQRASASSAFKDPLLPPPPLSLSLSFFQVCRDMQRDRIQFVHESRKYLSEKISTPPPSQTPSSSRLIDDGPFSPGPTLSRFTKDPNGPTESLLWGIMCFFHAS